MTIARREVVIGGGLLLAMAGLPSVAGAAVIVAGAYGQVGALRSRPGQRPQLAAVLMAGTGSMPGCLHYLIAEDLADADLLWVTEWWDSKASHDASLALPAVRDAITRGRPLIVGFEHGAQLRAIGGQGVPRR